jgi:hypothetical protein
MFYTLGRCRIKEVNKVYTLIRDHFEPHLEKIIQAQHAQSQGQKKK